VTDRQRTASTADGRRIQVTFLKTAPALRHFPPGDQPEIAFAGRSNAGKSSVLNRLTGSSKTAKVSKTPGRTQALNIFDVRGGGRLVDLPGYGYAKAGRSAQSAWQRNVNEYLSERDALVALVLVMDIRHPLSDLDLELLDWAHASELPVLALLNKADKLKHGQRQKSLRAVQQRLAPQPLASVHAFSAQTGLGADAVIERLEGWLAGSPQ
jgi:GTP-binding protein